LLDKKQHLRIISKDWQKWMVELRSAIHFCPLLPAQAGAGQKPAEAVKTLPHLELPIAFLLK
jgi:hypothetical protein